MGLGSIKGSHHPLCFSLLFSSGKCHVPIIHWVMGPSVNIRFVSQKEPTAKGKEESWTMVSNLDPQYTQL